jgi:hypothetical protein
MTSATCKHKQKYMSDRIAEQCRVDDVFGQVASADAAELQ